MPIDIAEYPLSANPPAGWSADFGYAVEIYFRTNPTTGDLEFAYWDSPINPFTLHAALTAIPPQVEAARTEMEFMSLADFNHQLDLRVGGNCFIILRADDNSRISWALDKDGVTLKDIAFQGYYFRLRYVKHGMPYSRGTFATTFPNEPCKQIMFGALHNTNDPTNYLHPFNLNVVVEDTLGNPTPKRIDPDIRNPGGTSELFAGRTPRAQAAAPRSRRAAIATEQG